MNTPLTGLDGQPRALVMELLRHGPLSRTALAQRLALSPASLTRLSKPLIDRAVVRERSPQTDPATGRPSRPLELRADAGHVVGVEVQHDRVHAVLTDLRSDVLDTYAGPLLTTTPVDVLACIVDLVRRLVAVAGSPVVGVGVSIGGLIEDHSIVVRAPFLRWSDPVDLGHLLTNATGIPAFVDNDLLALAKGEHWFGNGRGLDHFAVMTIGVGVGLGLIVHDQVVDTLDAGLGLVGHLPLDANGPLCREGHRGCAEAMLSTTSIAARYSIALGAEASFDATLDRAEEGDPAATLVVRDSATALGVMAALTANITQVTRIVLTGEGVRLAQVGHEHVTEALTTWRHSTAVPLEIVRVPTDYTTWARGAATSAIQKYLAR